MSLFMAVGPLGVGSGSPEGQDSVGRDQNIGRVLDKKLYRARAVFLLILNNWLLALGVCTDHDSITLEQSRSGYR